MINLVGKDVVQDNKIVCELQDVPSIIAERDALKNKLERISVQARLKSIAGVWAICKS